MSYYTSTYQFCYKKAELALFSGIYNNTVIKMQRELKVSKTGKSLSMCELFLSFKVKKNCKCTHVHTQTHTHTRTSKVWGKPHSFKEKAKALFQDSLVPRWE